MATVRGFAGGNSDRTDGLDMSGWLDAVPYVLVFLPGHVNYDPETGTYHQRAGLRDPGTGEVASYPVEGVRWGVPYYTLEDDLRHWVWSDFLGTDGSLLFRISGYERVVLGFSAARGYDDLLGGDDRVIGTAGRDRLLAGAGKDRIEGRAGDDVLLGNGGADRIFGGGHDDFAQGGGGRDRIEGGAGDDVLLGGGGGDRLWGGAGEDELSGGGGDDRLFGGRHSDTALPGGGSDRVDLGDDLAEDFLIYDDWRDSRPGSERDVIRNFDPRHDFLFLGAIDASVNHRGEQDFAVSGRRAEPYSVWFRETKGDVMVRADVDGDARADFEVKLVDARGFSAHDLIL